MSESFTAAMVDAARTIRVGQDVDCVLNDIVRAAVASLPGIDHAGVTIVQKTREYVTRASTDPLVRQLDALQYSLGEGPCVYAMEAERLVVVNNLRHEQRWPRYIPRAAQLGLRAQMGLQLVLDEHKIGGLNLYSTEADEIDPDVAHGAELFAHHAALALGFARRNEDLNTALGSRKIIGQAIGLVMAEFTVTEDQAFAYLRRISSITNTKLRDVAAKIVDHANDKAAAQAPHQVNGTHLTNGQIDGRAQATTDQQRPASSVLN
jgi:GAF domain-containing protein